MKYLVIDSDGQARQMDNLDQEVLEEFNDSDCDIFRFEDGEFQVPIIDTDEDADEGEENKHTIVSWNPVGR